MDEEIMSDDSDVDNPKNHSKLLSAISKLDYTDRVKPAIRKEPSHHVSEFHLAKAKKSKGKGGVDVKELADVLKSSEAISVRRKFTELNKKPTTLPKPLEKIVADKIQRKEGYEKVKTVLSRWDDVVESNRVADQLEFPAFNKDVKVFETNILSSVTEPKTELEKKVHSMLEQNGYITPKDPELEADPYPLTLEEVLAKRKEFGDLKRKSIQQQMKTWRQNKIKSKKFHRILRKEKMRQHIKEFETLKEKNPEEALKRLDAIEKSRAEERASLRHKNTGSWAKNQQIRARYNKDIREVLSQQIQLSRELSQKVKKPGDESTDEGESDEEGAAAPHPDLAWTEEKKKPQVADDVSSFVSGYRKFWEEQNKKKKPQKPEEGAENTEVEEAEELEIEEQEISQVEEKPANAENLCIEVEEDEKLELMEDLLEIRKNQRQFEKFEAGKSLKRKSKKQAVRKEKRLSSSGSWLIAEDDGANVIDLFDKLEKKQDQLIGKAIKRMQAEVEELEKPRVKGNKDKKNKQNKKNKSLPNDGMAEDVSEEREENSEVAKKRKGNASNNDIFGVKDIRQKEKQISKSSIETSNTEGTSKQNSTAAMKNILNSKIFQSVQSNGVDDNIDPTKFLDPKPLKSSQGEMIVIGGQDLDVDLFTENQKTVLKELFADDDVVEEFQKEKEELEEASKPKEIDMTLPGWGTWGGSNLQVPKRKRKKFILKPTVEAPRKDRNLRNVIIYEGKDSGVAEHQVSELPYPFTSVKQFEASLRAPIGRNWVPEAAHKQLTAPKLLIKTGQKIEPMTEEVLLKAAISKNKKLKIGK